MRLLVVLPVRPGELAQMRGEAVVLLRELFKTRVVDAEGKGWVFVSPVYPGRLINPTSVLTSFQHLWPEYDITAHGFVQPTGPSRMST